MIRPFRVSVRGLIMQAALTVLVIGITGGAVRAYFTGTFPVFKEKHILLLFDRALFLFYVTVAIFIFGNFFWLSFRLVHPLETIIAKARRLFSSQGIDTGGETARRRGFWSELDLTLELLKKELEKKTDRISREHAEIETVMSSVNESILAVDLKDRPLFFNSEFLLLFGGKDFHSKRPPLFEIFRDQAILEAFRLATHEGSRQTTQADIYVGPDSKKRTFSVSVAPLRKHDGEAIYGAVGLFHDVTELKRAEQIRIEFVGNVSHELRTPLTSIRGYADLLKDDIQKGKTDALTNYIEVISRNVSRLMALVNDLLDLSSLESGEAELNKTDLSTRDITERIIHQLDPHRKERKHQIRSEYKALRVFGDSKRIDQVLINLLENSIRHTPGENNIDVRWTEDRPGFVSLRIKDDGPGIPLEHQPRLFERFYRVDRSRARDQGGGTGLGLAIVKHVMQKHNGTVRVVSAPGEGTEFICEFPKS